MEDINLLKNIFLTFIYIKSAWVFLLNILNYNQVTQETSIPKIAQNHISIKDNLKAIAYNSYRLRWAPLIYVYNLLILIFWTIMGGLDILDIYIANMAYSNFSKSLILIVSFFLLNYLFSLPIQIFNIFHIEKKFNFNQTSIRLFFVDQIKGFALAVLLGIPILSIIIIFLNTFPDFWWIYTFIILTVFQFILIWLYPTFIAPIFNKFTPIKDLRLREKINRLLSSAEFSSDGIFVIDASKRSRHSNAYFTGFGKYKKIILFDTLLKELSDNELLAVLAHELGHFKKKHILKRLILGVLSSFLSFYILSVLIKSPLFFLSHDVQHVTMIKGMILYFIVFDIYTFWLAPIQNYLSRKHEFEADQYASEQASSKDLISALFKLQKENAGVLNPHPLYILNYYSHPTVINRAEKLIKI